MCRDNKKHTIEFCQEFVKDRGECLSTEYVDCKTKMEWKCNCGYEWPAKFDNIYGKNSWCPICSKEKRKATNIERYGTKSVAQNKEIQKRIKVTNIERYGVEYAFQVKEFKEKRKTTMVERHGVEYPLQSREIQEKTKATNLKRHGVEYPQQNPEIQEKSKATNIERHGVEYPQQNPEIALKGARKVNKPSIKYRWLTNEELVCQGSYEAKVVDYLNLNRINYRWQPETFKLSTGKTYRPDLYLVDEDIWVEIKGWMRQDAQLKWTEFLLSYPTAELWDKTKLKAIGII